MVERN